MNRLVLVSVILLGVSASGCAPPIQVLPLAHLNPTRQVFDMSIQPLHDKALALFSMEHQIGNPLFGPIPLARPLEGEVVLHPILSAESSQGAVMGASVFADPANVNDLYVHGFGEPFWRSPVYRGEEGGLPFMAAFHIHLAAAGPNQTMVTVTALDTRVINGRRYVMGKDVKERPWRITDVEPTTVEESIILRHLARGLGQRELPPLELPVAPPAVPTQGG